MGSKPRIVLLHATPLAMQPIMEAMGRLWPQAEPVNLLDDSLMIDRAKEGPELSEAMTQRFLELGRYAHRNGADGIIFTCSAFGPAIEQVARALPVPVLKPNEAMFGDALNMGARIALIATFGPSVPTMADEFATLAADRGVNAKLDTAVVPEALEALRGGGAEAHDALIADTAAKFGTYDAVMLAQFSMSGAAQKARSRISVPVLTSPDSAVLRMQQLLKS